jgi:hypothetical protein
LNEVANEDQQEGSVEKVQCEEKNGESFLVDSVEENKHGYTRRQFESAKQARKPYHTLGCPTVENFKHILRQSNIQNCPVTKADISTAERIFGPDIGTLKGKSTRNVPVAVKTDEIDIPQELKDMHKDLTLCIDIMFVNGMPMLTSIDRSIRFRAQRFGLVGYQNELRNSLRTRSRGRAEQPHHPGAHTGSIP